MKKITSYIYMTSVRFLPHRSCYYHFTIEAIAPNKVKSPVQGHRAPKWLRYDSNLPNSKVHDSSTRMLCTMVPRNTETNLYAAIHTQVKCALVICDIFHRKFFYSISRAWHSLDILFSHHFYWFIWCWLRSSISTEWNQIWELTRTKGRDIF